MKFDILIVGSGIVGLATAYQLRFLYPNIKIILLEKEYKASLHQTGRNSGVVHSGIYYKPGSLKAKNCIEGKNELLQFCERKNIPTKQVGKIIVATNLKEIKWLHDLYLQGIENGIKPLLIKSDQIQEIEPYVCAEQAIWLPKCSIVSFSQVADELQKELQRKGVEILFKQKVLWIKNEKNQVIVETNRQSFCSRYVINCAGLYSDMFVDKSFRKDYRIIPFKGEYFHFVPQRKDRVRGLVYPVKDPNLPFLGAHLTKMIDGEVHAGPNAILALAKEGYGKKEVHFRELFQTISYPGFWKMAVRYLDSAIYEMYRSFSKHAFVKDLRRFFPELKEEDLIPTQSGIRAQVVMRNGKLLDDFLFKEEKNTLHVVNAPSPAATASFSIGRHIARMISTRF